MWTTVLVMAFAVILEPVRIGLAVLMLNRPRPLLQLLAFLCGGMSMGVGVGLVILFILRSTPLATGRFSVASVQVTVGVTALVVALLVVLSSRLKAAAPAVAATPASSTSGAPPGRVRRVLQGDSLWTAWVTGLGTALPSANFLGAMAVILASGETAVTQAQALLLFNLVAFLLVELPLVGYLAAPRRTTALLASLHSWLQARPRRDIGLMIGGSGVLMLGIGVAGL